MENNSDTNCDRSTYIGSQIMEYQPNSKPENSDKSTGIIVESHNLLLTEHYILTRAINHWDVTNI